MPNFLKIVISLTVITGVCGLALGALYEGTRDQILLQVLQNKQLPAAQKVLPEADNDLLADHKLLDLGERDKRAVFVASKQGEPYGVAFEVSSSKGFGGAIGVLVGFDLESGNLLGAQVTTHSETPGVGARAATDAAFSKQFSNLGQDADFRVTQDGGQIDALTGATVTSRAVCDAVQAAVAFNSEHADEISSLVGSPTGANAGGER